MREFGSDPEPQHNPVDVMITIMDMFPLPNVITVWLVVRTRILACPVNAGAIVLVGESSFYISGPIQFMNNTAQGNGGDLIVYGETTHNRVPGR